jgi:hypothetical protein
VPLRETRVSTNRDAPNLAIRSVIVSKSAQPDQGCRNYSQEALCAPSLDSARTPVVAD